MTEPLDLQDLTLRATAAAQRWSGGCVVEDVTFLPGGTASLVYTANVRAKDDGVERAVLKVAPPGLPPVRNRGVLRRAPHRTRRLDRRHLIHVSPRSSRPSDARRACRRHGL